MYTIVGLGNIGAEYKDTRHNVGWIVLEQIVKKHGLPSLKNSGMYTALLSEGSLYGASVGVLFPTTFMNNSGKSVFQYIRARGSLETLIVVHDDIDLAFGDVRVSYDRGAGGHNGVRSVINACGGAFIRIRIGIAQKGFFGGVKRPTGDKLSDYVLGVFASKEVKQFPEITSIVEKALERILTKGVQHAMQECN